MLCVHNTDKPYYCEICQGFFKVKSDYESHVLSDHPERLPEDLQQEPTSVGNIESISDISTITVEEPSPAQMSVEKMRTLVALLLKKISTPSRLKKLGFGSRLIDEVLRESIEASGRSAHKDDNSNEGANLIKNIEILLDWTIPAEYMNYFRQENKSVIEILEELAA